MNSDYAEEHAIDWQSPDVPIGSGGSQAHWQRNRQTDTTIWASAESEPTMATKYEILVERLADLEMKAENIRHDLEWMANTKFGKPCIGCNQILETERDFAAHFEIPDTRYLNLGNCPVMDR